MSLTASILLVLLAGVPSASQQQAAQRDVRQWYQAYSDGKQAVDKGDYPSAVQSLLSAKQSGPAPGRRVPFYRDIFDTFDPDYYLGVAYYYLKQYPQADAAFDAVKKAGLVVRGDKEFATLNTLSSHAKFEVALADASALADQKKFTEAIAALDRAAAMNIDNQRVTQLRAKVTALIPSPTPPPTTASTPPAPPPSSTPPSGNGATTSRTSPATSPSSAPGKPDVRVPDLLGRTQEDALALLKGVELAAGGITIRGDQRPAGTVVAQQPAAGQTVPIGAAVSLTVAGTVDIRVPQLVGRTREDALAMLRRVELTAGQIGMQEARLPEGTVVAQQPAAGQPVPAGAPVDFTVAGPPVSASPPRGTVPTSVRPPAPPPVNSSQTLEAGVVAFLSGDYVTAAGILAPLAGGAPRSPRVALYLASSKVAMRLTGQGTEALVAEAQADLRTAGLINTDGTLTQSGAQALAADLPFISPAITSKLGVKR